MFQNQYGKEFFQRVVLMGNVHARLWQVQCHMGDQLQEKNGMLDAVEAAQTFAAQASKRILWEVRAGNGMQAMFERLRQLKGQVEGRAKKKSGWFQQEELEPSIRESYVKKIEDIVMPMAEEFNKRVGPGAEQIEEAYKLAQALFQKEVANTISDTRMKGLSDSFLELQEAEHKVYASAADSEAMAGTQRSHRSESEELDQKLTKARKDLEVIEARYTWSMFESRFSWYKYKREN